MAETVTVTLLQLTDAVHLMRHEHADLWPVADNCGCFDWAQTLWDNLAHPSSDIEPDGDPGFCRSCGARVYWRLTAAGKKAPFNADGVNHFATCPQADEWRRR